MSKEKPQYVTVKFGGKNIADTMYTYRNEGEKLPVGSTVMVDARFSGVRPADVVHVSDVPPSKKPAPDGYKGPARDKILRGLLG